MHGSVFYCVANMPGAVPHTSTYALTNATLPYVLRLAEPGLGRCDRGRRRRSRPASRRTTARCTSLQVAHDLGLPYADPHALLPA